MALTQNRLLLLCEAIPHLIDDPILPRIASNSLFRPSSGIELAQQSAMCASTSSSSADTPTRAESRGYTPTELKIKADLDDMQNRIDISPPPFSRTEEKGSSSSRSSSSSNALAFVSPRGINSAVTIESTLSSDRIDDASSPPSVPTLVIIPEKGSSATEGSLNSARSVTGKRKAASGGHHSSERAIPIKLSKKLGAGFIIFGITSHFNAGDTEKLRETIMAHVTDDCHFHVKSLTPVPTTGNARIVTYLCALLDALPDTYIITANETVLDEFTLKVSIKFRGTMLHKCESSTHFMKEKLVDNMNLSRFSEADTTTLRSQEAALVASGVPIELVFQGAITVGFTEKIYDNRKRSLIDFSRVTGKINSFVLEYDLKSFKDAAVPDPSAI